MGSDEKKPTPENGTLLQGYEWNALGDGKHYERLTGALKDLKGIGISNIWLPPGCKASSPEGVGYDIYDLYDLGEFDQKGTTRTKWGSKEELLNLSKKGKELGVGLYWDAVLNHKAAADKKEKVKVVEVDESDRNKVTSGEQEIQAWVGFDFPGRGDKYSKQKYHWYHFSGVDYDAATGKKAIFRIQGENKGWSESVDDEQGNADFMMFADLDYSHEEVENDVKNWGAWITKEVGLKGFRLDAVQHFSGRFTKEWVDYIRKESGEDVFIVGEFWVGEVKTMTDWLAEMNREFSLYDSPLLYNFSNAGKQEKSDLRKVFDNTLVKAEPVNAVTVVMNHDTQPGQTVETPIEGFFKPLAYSLILLRSEGYPCVFYGDLYGMLGRDGENGGVPSEPPACGGKLPDLCLARNLYAYGEQNDYFDEANLVGFVRRGTHDRPDGLACIMSNAEPGKIRMFVGEEHKGETWTDVLEWEKTEVKIGDDGFGEFCCPGTSVAVFVNKDAQGRDRFPVGFDSDIYKGAQKKEKKEDEQGNTAL